MNEESHLKEIKKTLNQSLTDTKPLFISDTVARTGLNAFAVYALEDSTFTTLNAILDSRSNTLTAKTLKAGHIWYIPISGTVTLATGSVIVYQYNR